MQTHDKLDDIGFATTDEADIKPKGEMRRKFYEYHLFLKLFFFVFTENTLEKISLES